MGKYEDILLVSDWDRTVTGPDRTIPSANTEAVLRFMEEGGLFTIATGHTRMSHGSRWDQIPTNAPCVIFNGSEIYDYARGESLWCADLPADTGRVLTELMTRWPGLHYEIQCPNETYVFGEDMGLADIMKRMGVPIRQAPLEEVPRPWVQLAVSGTPKDTGDQGKDFFRATDPETETVFGGVLRYFEDCPGYDAARSLPFLVEVQAAGCSKGAAARRLAKLLGRRTLVCCGDAPNDLTMLREADLAFVAGDGDRGLLELGFPVTVPSDVGVLADVIGRL